MIIYFLQVSLAWLAFMLLYYFGLRQEKLLVANRTYLLGTFCIALVLPLVQWPIAEVLPAVDGGEISYWLGQVIVTGQEETSSEGINALSWLWHVYWIGCGIALLRLLWGLYDIGTLIKRTSFRQESGVLIGELVDHHSPFSWGRYLFINRDLQAGETAYEAIIAHEKAHIQQLHSFDLLLVQTVGIFFWWNPLWYVYRRMLTDVHEYLADAAAIRQLPRRAYGQLLLLQHISPERTPYLSHAFHTSQIKSRIMMLTKKKVGRFAAWKYLALLPILALVLFACNAVENPDTVEMKKGLDDYEFVESIDTIITFNAKDYTETVELVRTKAYKEAEIMPLFGNCPDLSGEELRQCSDRNMLNYIYEAVEYPAIAREAGVEGMVLAKIIIDKNGQVSSAEIVPNAGKAEKGQLNVIAANDAAEVTLNDKEKGMQAIQQEVLRVVNAMPDWQPGTINSEPVQVQVMLPVRFKLQ